MLKLLILLAPIAFIDGIGPVRAGALVALLGARRPWGSTISFLLGTVVLPARHRRLLRYP